MRQCSVTLTVKKAFLDVQMEPFVSLCGPGMASPAEIKASFFATAMVRHILYYFLSFMSSWPLSAFSEPSSILGVYPESHILPLGV